MKIDTLERLSILMEILLGFLSLYLLWNGTLDFFQWILIIIGFEIYNFLKIGGRYSTSEAILKYELLSVLSPFDIGLIFLQLMVIFAVLVVGWMIGMFIPALMALGIHLSFGFILEKIKDSLPVNQLKHEKKTD